MSEGIFILTRMHGADCKETKVSFLSFDVSDLRRQYWIWLAWDFQYSMVASVGCELLDEFDLSIERVEAGYMRLTVDHPHLCSSIDTACSNSKELGLMIGSWLVIQTVAHKVRVVDRDIAESNPATISCQIQISFVGCHGIFEQLWNSDNLITHRQVCRLVDHTGILPSLYNTRTLMREVLWRKRHCIWVD